MFLHQEEQNLLRYIFLAYIGKESDNKFNLHFRQPLQGQLSKYTNMVKGWQYRHFVLEPTVGRLSYYEVIVWLER